MWGDFMVKKVFIILFVVVCFFSSRVNASILPISSVVTNDGDISFAVVTYDKADMEDFRLKRDMKHFYPVGILVQNNSGKKIAIDQIYVTSANNEKIYNHEFTPFGKRIFGTLADKKILNNAVEINDIVTKRYYSKKTSFPLQFDEIFYKPYLNSGEAFFGIIYLDKRDKSLKPEKIKNIDGVMINIPFWRDNFSKNMLAQLSLQSPEAVITQKTGIVNLSDVKLKCANDACKKMSNAEFYDLTTAFNKCYMESTADNWKVKGQYWGERAWGRIIFNKYGEQLSKTVLMESKNKSLNSTLDKVMLGMQNCEISYKGKRLMVEDKKPLYDLTLYVGDVVAKNKITPEALMLKNNTEH